MVEVKERLENGIDVLSISNSHLTVEVTNFGCTLLKIVTKDKNDQDCDCILGFEHVEDYLTLGDHVKCKCLGKDKMGRISFSIKDAM